MDHARIETEQESEEEEEEDFPKFKKDDQEITEDNEPTDKEKKEKARQMMYITLAIVSVAALLFVFYLMRCYCKGRRPFRGDRYVENAEDDLEMDNYQSRSKDN